MPTKAGTPFAALNVVVSTTLPPLFNVTVNEESKHVDPQPPTGAASRLITSGSTKSKPSARVGWASVMSKLSRPVSASSFPGNAALQSEVALRPKENAVAHDGEQSENVSSPTVVGEVVEASSGSAPVADVAPVVARKSALS